MNSHIQETVIVDYNPIPNFLKIEEVAVTAISDLEIFSRVARTGNMSEAGREKGLSPAVVSKRISMLEARLEARLFQRTTRQLTLTVIGEGYFKRVVDILNLVEEAEDFVSRHNGNPRGLLRVTAPTSFSRSHIAPYLPEFFERYPAIEFDFHLTDTFLDIVRQGFDVAIRIAELKDSSLVARKLAPNKRVLCASPDYLKREGEPKTLEDLNHHNCLVTTAQEHWRLAGPEGLRSIKVRGNIRSNSSEFARESLLAGLGIALRSTWDVGSELKRGDLKVVLPHYKGSSSVGVFAVYPCRDFMPAKVEAFIDYLGALYGNEPYWDQGLVLE